MNCVCVCLESKCERRELPGVLDVGIFDYEISFGFWI